MKTIKTLLEIPAKYKWITVDESGLLCMSTSKPFQGNRCWFSHGDMEYLFTINPPKDWTKAIWRIEEYDEV